MNENKQRNDRSPLQGVLPSLGLLLLAVALALLLALPSCSQPSSGAPLDGTDPSDTSKEDPTDTAPHASEESSGTLSDADREVLLYYVSLVEELQEEIRELRAENFILSTIKPETDAPAASEENPVDCYTYEIKDGGVTILSYVGNDKSPTVPREIGGSPVVRIGEGAFSGTDVVSVVLPDTVISIDWFAFASCNSLRSVTAGDSITSVGYGAFDGCPASLTLICPDGSYLSKYGKSFGIAVKAD